MMVEMFLHDPGMRRKYFGDIPAPVLKNTGEVANQAEGLYIEPPALKLSLEHATYPNGSPTASRTAFGEQYGGQENTYTNEG